MLTFNNSKSGLSAKHLLQRLVMAMPERLRAVVLPPIRGFAERDQLRRLNESVQQAAALIAARAGQGRNPKIFVDCGFNNGMVLQKFIGALPPSFRFYGFEVQEDLAPGAEEIRRRNHDRVLGLDFAAVSDRDGTTEYYPSRDVPWGVYPHVATTTERGRAVGAHMDYSVARSIRSVNFSRWLAETFDRHSNGRGAPFIVVKMNIEGAEYPALYRALRDGNLGKIGLLIAEFHKDQFSGEQFQRFSRMHADIAEGLKRLGVPVMEWR